MICVGARCSLGERGSARHARLSALAALALWACGPPLPDSNADDDDDGVADGGTGDPCDAPDARCVGASYQECRGGAFREIAQCSAVCSVALGGCADCIPDEGAVCDGNAVYTCNDDGSRGALIEQCGSMAACDDGECVGNCGGAGAQLIYVVDQTNRLLSFDPLAVDSPQDPFTLIGTLACPSGATPFSMAVDRDTTAWVLYADGQIFKVSTVDASCQASSFQVNQVTSDGTLWSVFGMGFVADAADSDAETLFITNANQGADLVSHLGTIDTGSLTITSIAVMESGAELTPELSGSGSAELYGYYPGSTSTFVAQIDKTTALRGTTWPMPGLGGSVEGWAFAHWGGRFYVFVTVSGNSQVLLVDPMQGGETTVLAENLGYVIVGAGVSTCAPFVVP